MDRQLAAIAKNAKEKILVSESEYGNRELIDVRVYYLDDNDELHPTKKGIAMSKDTFPEFAEMIEQVKQQLLSEEDPFTDKDPSIKAKARVRDTLADMGR